MSLINLNFRSRKQIPDSEILLAGPVRNASAHIENDIEKVLRSLGQFKKVYCFIVESDSSGDTLQRLEAISKNSIIFRLSLQVNLARNCLREQTGLRMLEI